MKRYKISFEYLGSAFLGSQIQKQGSTVQGELTDAICTLIKKDTKVIMAGRTDKGVNALCQTAHFDAPEIKNHNKFLISLNAILSKNVRVFEIENVVASFHAQKSAKFRHYRYIIKNSIVSSVFDLNVLHYRLKLNPNRMRDAIKYIIGEFDFSAFKSVSDNPVNICKIYYADVKFESEYILIDIIGNRFLYNMVRAIVGTLLLIERKDLEPDFMKKVLISRKREYAGANVDPVGLTLIKTGYVDPTNYIKHINERR